MTNSLDNVIGSTVYGPGDEKIGKVKQVYINNQTGSPTWASVSTGLFSSDSLVPLAGASHTDDNLRVRVDKSAVKDAPHLDEDGQITAEQENALFRHYGVDSAQSGWDDHRGQPTQGAPNAGQQQADPAGKHAAAGGGLAAGTAAGTGRPRTDTTQADATRRNADPSLVRSEEHLEVGTESQATGTARLRKHVVTEEQTVTVPVSHEEVRVVREPISDPSKVRSSDLGDDAREVTLHEDKVTVSKQSVPVEQVRLDVDNVTDEKTITDTVRKERIDVDGVDTPRTDRR